MKRRIVGERILFCLEKLVERSLEVGIVDLTGFFVVVVVVGV